MRVYEYAKMYGDLKKYLMCLTMAAVFAFFSLPFSASAASAPTVSEKPVLLKDFVHAYELKAGLEGALCKVALPDYVYGGLIRSQHLDLAVFNANGEIVPFVVLPMMPIYDASASRSDLQVPLFELPADEKTNSASGGVDPLDIYVRTDTGGQVVEIRGTPSREASRERRYLLDFSAVAVNENASSHRLDLFVPEEIKLNAGVDVFQSANLRDWRPVLKGVPLIQLRNKDARLANNALDLPEAPARYLLLRVSGADAGFVLKDVRYSFTFQSSLIMDERETFEGTPKSDRRAVEYDTKGAYPATKINFVLQEPGLYRVRYSSRAGADDPWRPLGTMELSMIRESSSAVRTNPSVSLDTREDRYWRIDFENAFSGLPPKMKINWRASEVYFLAQGRAPWILAFGSSRRDLVLQNDSLVRDRQLRATATESSIGSTIDPDKDLALAPGGESASQERFTGIEWQRWLVWGLMVLAALLLSAMSWKLLKGANAKK